MLGARPLRRTIQREIEDHLSEKILFGELKAGQIVIVDAEGEGEEAKFVFTRHQQAGGSAGRSAGRGRVQGGRQRRHGNRLRLSRFVTGQGE